MPPGNTPIAAVCAALLCAALAGCAGEETLHPLPDGKQYDVTRYALRGAYDADRERLDATVEIALAPLEPNVSFIILDSEVTEVKAVRGPDGADLAFDAADGRLRVDVASLRGQEAVFEIDYEAARGDHLRGVPSRPGDPVGVPAVYTFSEPLGAAQWMPCHNRPDDRALFSVEMEMDEGERMIANGDLVLDEPAGPARRRMAYATQYSLPTYLMAFAISDFEVTEAQAGALPIAVWRRRGVAGDFDGVLTELARQIDLFSGLLGPYPFEKYALVLVPDFSGGMEHASITFQHESGTAEPSLASDTLLTAHELGHQWFGDMVTVATWDDVWIKEGMATLLAEEALRSTEDQSGAGTLAGDTFYIRRDQSIRDTSLAPDDKYTTGPYDRAAWLLTEIRRRIGEDAFWAALRGVLEDHRMGTIGTDDFLEAFAPALGPDGAAAARRAIDAKDLPTLAVAPAGGDGALVTVQDPGGILVSPLSIAWRHPDGTETHADLTAGTPFEIRRPAAGDLLVLDPLDVHPDLGIFFDNRSTQSTIDTFYGTVYAQQIPETQDDVAAFSELSGAQQLSLLYNVWPAPVGSNDLPAFIDSLDAESAKAVAIAAACAAADTETEPEARDAWMVALTAQLSGPPYFKGISYLGSYDNCAKLVPSLPLFPSEWADLHEGLAAPTIPEDRLTFLSLLRLPGADALDIWGNVARNGYSMRARVIAARQIRRYAKISADAAPQDLPAWRALLLELLDGGPSEVLRQLIPATRIVGGATADLLAALGAILREPDARTVHASAVCTAFALTGGKGSAWTAFVTGLDPSTLSERARLLLADPTRC